MQSKNVRNDIIHKHNFEVKKAEDILKENLIITPKYASRISSPNQNLIRTKKKNSFHNDNIFNE